MAPFRSFNRLFVRGFILLTLLLVFFNESLIYSINRISWQTINCKYENCTRILFIADPQILGNVYDKSLYGPLARVDADRYLQKTFAEALTFTQPDIICFLGDLLDEGSIATAEEYHSYTKRFNNIFHTDSEIPRIHVPGDNDIGGENGEYISNTNVARFEFEFMRDDLFDYDNRLRFFKINRMQLDFTNPDIENNGNRLRIGISHAPLLIGGGPLLRRVINQLDPHIMFTAHWHESRIFLYPSTKVINFYENTVRHFDLKYLKSEHNYLEIMVPTSSYRMGKKQIGIGFGVLENYDLSYTVLWMPNRIACLIVYAFWFFFALCISIVFKMMTGCPFRVAKRHVRESYPFM